MNCISVNEEKEAKNNKCSRKPLGFFGFGGHLFDSFGAESAGADVIQTVSGQMYDALMVINAAAFSASALTNLHPKAQLCTLPILRYIIFNCSWGEEKKNKQKNCFN